MDSPSVVAYCLAFLKELVLLARWPSEDKIVNLPQDLLDDTSLAGKIVLNCKMLR